MKEGWAIIPKAEYLKFEYRNPKLETDVWKIYFRIFRRSIVLDI